MTASPTPTPGRTRVSVDWVYVRYRTVGWLSAALIVGGILLTGWWWWSQHGAPDEQGALEAVAVAEASVERAEAKEPEAAELKLARGHLRRAQEELQARQFGSAIDEATAAGALALEVLQGDDASRNASVRVARIEGDVRVKRAGQFLWEAATEQSVLEANDQIRTGSDGTVQLVYVDGSVMSLSPGTLLELRSLHRDPHGREQRVSERLAWGSLRGSTDAPEGVRSIHEVATDSASISALHGSEFQVRHDRERGRSEVVSLKGDVTVKTGDKEISLQPNSRVAVAGGEVVEQGMLIDAPRPVSPPDQKTFLGSSDGQVSLTWTTVSGAARYHLQLSDRPLFNRTMLDMALLETSTIDLPPLAAGDYYWRVAALDGKHQPGQWSDVRRFRLLDAEYHDTEDKDPPLLEISEILVVGTNAIVTGASEPGALVWVDGERVDINDAGAFNWVVKLRSDGENKLQFLAQDAAGNETRRIGYAYVDVF